MSYCINYSGERKESSRRDAPGIRIALMTAAFFVVFCLYTGRFWPRGQEALQQLLFPGSNLFTRQAAEVFVSELQNGEPLGDALENFCREIIHDADFS